MPTETGCPTLVPVSWEISELELGVTSACLAKLFPSPAASTAHSFCVLSPGLAHHRTLSKACGTSLKNAEGHSVSVPSPWECQGWAIKAQSSEKFPQNRDNTGSPHPEQPSGATTRACTVTQ